MGDNSDKKKNMGKLIFDDEFTYEISKFYHAWFLRYHMRDEQKDGRTTQKQYVPSTSLKLGA